MQSKEGDKLSPPLKQDKKTAGMIREICAQERRTCPRPENRQATRRGNEV